MGGESPDGKYPPRDIEGLRGAGLGTRLALDGSMPRPTDDTCGKSYDTVATVAKDFQGQLDKLRATAVAAGVLPGDLRDTLQRYNIDL